MRSLSTAIVLAVVVPIFWPATAQADLAIHIEDFEEDGEPGFDPLFNHDFWREDGETPSGGIAGLELNWMLMLAFGTTDTITFNLDPDQPVVYASVECLGGDYWVRFVGLDTDVTFTGVSYPEINIYEASSTEIGEIVAIELMSAQGRYDNVTIYVVPEPSAPITLLIVLAMSGGVMGLLRKSRSSRG